MTLDTLVNFGILSFSFLFLWLFLLSFFLFRTVRHYRRLTKGIARKDLETVLNRLLNDLEKEGVEIEKLKEVTEDLKKEGVFHFQKIGLIRFNPFRETGGDQSFSLALLDGENNGVVISSLYHREGTRIYAKPVKKGKGAEYELSEEEKKVIEKAIKK